MSAPRRTLVVALDHESFRAWIGRVRERDASRFGEECPRFVARPAELRGVSKTDTQIVLLRGWRDRRLSEVNEFEHRLWYHRETGVPITEEVV